MKFRSRSLGIVAMSFCAVAAQAQVTGMTVKSSFGTNGWLAPGSSSFLGTGNNERGMAYNPVTGNLVLVSRSGGNNVRILSGTSGADLGGLNTTGITGGTFQVNTAGVGDDGAIYVANLSTSVSSAFKVYKWASESDTGAPTVAYTKVPDPITRVGDSFAVYGSGANTKFAAAGGTTTLNGTLTVGLLDGTNTSTGYTSISGTTGSSNDYRLGLTFVDADTVIGTQGGNARWTDVGASATVVGSSLFGAAQRFIDYTTIGGIPYLAIADSNSSLVSIYNVSTPGTPVLVASGNATSGTLSGNGNGVGALQWGNVTATGATLYAMSTNQGIQAFDVQAVPEPGTILALSAGAAFLARRRRK